MWLINLYFLNDPIGPADYPTWLAELANGKVGLGMGSPVPCAFDVFLPALPNTDNPSDDEVAVVRQTTAEPGDEQQHDLPSDVAPSATPTLSSELTISRTDGFGAWAQRWMALADYPGRDVPDVDHRIEQLVEHWRADIPGEWKRGLDSQLLGPRYRRGDIASPHNGEHAIEYEILCQHFDSVSCLNGKLMDGVNALPLARDTFGGRRGNVEADLFLLIRTESAYRLAVCEVKHSSVSAWFAAVENLRQLRLLRDSGEVVKLFEHRHGMNLGATVPVSGLVIAPEDFYRHAGKKSQAIAPAQALLQRFRWEFGVDAHLTVWNPAACSVAPLQ